MLSGGAPESRLVHISSLGYAQLCHSAFQHLLEEVVVAIEPLV